VASPAKTAAPDIDQVVIPDTPSPVPVEKQMREPTAYERAELEFRNAVARLRQGRVVDAEAGFRAALKEDRSHAAARQALIGLLVDSGRHTDAEEVLREALAFNPRQPRHAMLLARLELERGDAASAAKTLEAVRTYAGVDADYYAFLAAVYQRLERHEQAIELYTNALAVAPGNAVWMMGLGISLQALQRADEARTAFSRAAESKALNADLQAFVESRLRELSAPRR
jgi:MSHA biogenesis protein MshN